jgi:hypothetical protein
MKLFNRLFNEESEPWDYTPRPKWSPDLRVDIDQILERAKFYTGQKLQIAIFSHGTIVIFPGRSGDITRKSLQILNKIHNSHQDFNPIAMDDGNFLIEYRQSAFTIVFKEELENHWEYIERNHLDGLCASEVSMNGQGTTYKFDSIGKIALFARAKMFQDAQNPRIVKIFDPQHAPLYTALRRFFELAWHYRLMIAPRKT